MVKPLENPPVVIIMAGNRHAALLPIKSGIADCELPVAGRCLLEYCLMELMALGIKQSFIIANENAVNIQSLVGGGERWGMNIEVMQYRTSESEILKNFASLSEPDGLLVVDANKLRGYCMHEFISRARKSKSYLLRARVKRQGLGLTYLKGAGKKKSDKILQLGNAVIAINHMQTLQDYHRANLDVIKGCYAGLVPNAKEGEFIFKHHHTFVHKQTKVMNDVMVGEHCHVSKGAFLSDVVLNGDVYIDSQSRLHNSVVLPKTYIGKKLQIKNAIVCPDKIIQIDTGEVVNFSLM